MIRPASLALLLAFAAVLAGCAAPAPDAAVPDGADVPSGTGDVTNATGPAPAQDAPVVLAVDAPQATQTDAVTLTGTVDQPARLLVTRAQPEAGAANDLARPIDVPAGAWSVQVPLDPGQTALAVTADTGRSTAQASVVAVRLASATFEAVFAAAVPPHASVSDLVWYDPDALASAPAYEGKSMGHPPHATVHDLMATWEQQSGKRIDYSYFDSLGYSPDRIDGVGQPLTAAAPPYWCYTLNGQNADLGISLQELNPGDVVHWEYGACA